MAREHPEAWTYTSPSSMVHARLRLDPLPTLMRARSFWSLSSKRSRPCCRARRLQYPELLRQAGIQGRVIVQAIIDTTGCALVLDRLPNPRSKSCDSGQRPAPPDCESARRIARNLDLCQPGTSFFLPGSASDTEYLALRDSGISRDAEATIEEVAEEERPAKTVSETVTTRADFGRH